MTFSQSNEPPPGEQADNNTIGDPSPERKEKLHHKPIHVKLTADIPVGTRLRVTLEALSEDDAAAAHGSSTITLEGEGLVTTEWGRPALRYSTWIKARAHQFRRILAKSSKFLLAWMRGCIADAAETRPIVQVEKYHLLIPGIATIIASQYIILQQEPIQQMRVFAEWLNNLFRIDVPNLENTILAMYGFLIGSLLVAFSIKASKREDLSIPDDTVDGNLIKTHLPTLRQLLIPSMIAFLFITWQLAYTSSSVLYVYLWILSIVLAAIAAFLIDRWRKIPVLPRLSLADLALLCVLFLAGIIVGAYRLQQVPNILMGDEGAFWETAVQIARGNYLPDFFGFGVYSFPVPSSIYQAWIIKLFGETLWSWRFASVLIAVLAVIPTYLLALEMFNRKVAFLASGIMVLTPYFIAFERLGYNNSQALLPTALALYLVYVGLKRNSLFHLYLGGIVAGLGFYTYHAARLGLVTALLLLTLLLITKVVEKIRVKRSSRQSPGTAQNAAMKPILILGVVFILGWAMTTIPHLIHGGAISTEDLNYKTFESVFPNINYANHLFSKEELFRDYPPINLGPEQFFYRPDLYARLLIRGIIRSFLVFHHDQLVTEHFISEPLTGPYASAFYLLGLILTIVGARRKNFSLIGIWFFMGVFMLSIINTYPPRHQHLVSIIPVLSILTALGIVLIAEVISGYAGKLRMLFSGLIIASCFSLIAFTNLRNFFVEIPAQYVPNFENRLAFASLEVSESSHIILVYEDPTREGFIPWMLHFIPTQAEYRNVLIGDLETERIEENQHYIFFFEGEDQEEVSQILHTITGQQITTTELRNKEGQLLGASYTIGKPLKPTPLELERDKLSGLIVIMSLGILSILGTAVYIRMRKRISQTGGKSLDWLGRPDRRTVEDLRKIESGDTSPDKASEEVPSPIIRWVQFERVKTLWQDVSRRVVKTIKNPSPIVIPAPRLTVWMILLEFLFLSLIIVLFSMKFLVTDATQILSGNEYGVMAFLDYIMVNSLERFGEVPLWNFFIRTGQPLLADPFMHSLNPISSVPVLIFGVTNGFKVAVFLSILLAAIGQWVLGYALGFNRVARLWCAILYALNGQIAARFLQAQFLFIFGYAWIPFVFTGIILSLRHRRMRYFVFTALSIGLLFLSGNIYYSYYMAIILVLFTMIAFVQRDPQKFVKWNWKRVTPLLLIGILAIGISAVQLLPTRECWPHIQKSGDPELTTSQSPVEALKNYVLPTRNREKMLETLPPEEFYGYISIAPFILGLFAIGSYIDKWRRKEILCLFGLFIIALGWTSLRYTPIASLYRQIPILYQFRYPSRIMIFGSIAIITVSGIGLTWFMNRLGLSWAAFRQQETDERLWNLRKFILTILLALLVFSALHVFITNERLVHTYERYEEADQLLEWLKNYDTSPNYVSIPISTGWHTAAATYGQRYLDAWYGYGFFPPVESDTNYRSFDPDANYLILGKGVTPDDPDATIIHEYEVHYIYALEDSLPYAFAVSESTLTQKDSGEIGRSEVTPLDDIVEHANGISVNASLPEEDMWIVLQINYFPGWQVTVDQQPQELHYINQFIAVKALPGSHNYEFNFKPSSVKIGFIITLATLIIMLGMVLKDSVIGSLLDRFRHLGESKKNK